ncbi:hypothetical protein B0181_07895 [Moraxella caviae]|uniref:Single-stranded DNA-binding protein n=1 Tax=Moraxella caviae TaxID=34060 RepID=A0A1S9ZZ07_9GAMM|nr:single-stranded DNA-binding protein [Moraxella caviae]OOR88629.1 hypothetical protein B0181_07895 [Moraxella caviae]STZ13688.1 Helix-destabilizing protein [Moraxella caviae]
MLNRVTLIGSLGKDPVIHNTRDGKGKVATLSIATSERWTDRNTGERKEQTEWHTVKFFGNLAEICEKFLVKGSTVHVEGSLVTNHFVDKNGQERSQLQIRGTMMNWVGGNRRDPKAPANFQAQNGFNQQRSHNGNQAQNFNRQGQNRGFNQPMQAQQAQAQANAFVQGDDVWGW